MAVMEQAPVGELAESELLELGLPLLNTERSHLGLKPLESWPDEASRGDWNHCLIGRAMGGRGLNAYQASLREPVLAEIEYRFETGELEMVSALPGPDVE
jgi:hypothetical protein